MSYVFISKNRKILILAIVSILFLFVYSWLPYQTGKDGEFRLASPDGTANYFWAERYATLSPLSLRGSVNDRSNPVSDEKSNGIASPTARNDSDDSSDSGLTYFEPLNLIADDIVIPRSVRSENGIVKPVSFLGIILIYGWMAKIFGIWIIKYLTPLFAVIGVFCFYGIIKRVFTEKTAFISALMFLVFAPYWYYTARSMFHNVLLVDLVLIGLLFLINSTRIERIKRIYTDFVFIFSSGVFIGLAIITRVSELIWLAPVMLILLVGQANCLSNKQIYKLILFFCGIILALIPMLYYNQILYGDWLKFGYGAEQKAVNLSSSSDEEETEVVLNNSQPPPVPLLIQEGGTKGISIVQNKINKILPFGFYPKNIVRNFYYYFIIIFWYLFWPSLLGGILFLWKYKERNKQEWLYFVSFYITSVILVIFYGSWNIQDNIRLDSITIGNSYTRYWLPMYIMSIPLAVMFFQWIASMLSFLFLSVIASPDERSDIGTWQSRKNCNVAEFTGLPHFAHNDKKKMAGITKNIIISLFVIAFFILNTQTVIYGQDEGLIYVKQGIEENKERAKHINSIIGNDAIIITKHLDKFFWPNKKVIAGDLLDDNKNQQYKKLVDRNVPLYYYGFIFQQKDLDFLYNTKLKDLNLEIQEIELNEEAKLGLYKIISY